jgi:hypothetical protein
MSVPGIGGSDQIVFVETDCVDPDVLSLLMIQASTEIAAVAAGVCGNIASASQCWKAAAAFTLKHVQARDRSDGSGLTALGSAGPYQSDHAVADTTDDGQHA